MTTTTEAVPAVQTNIKNLPAGRRYWTEYGYSQSYPWVEIARTETTRTLIKVEVKADPEWKPEILPGGFCGHCTNQSEQTWLFDRDNADRKITIRKTKLGWSRCGVKFRENVAREFYDYNF